jgi:hypothetical protein
MLQYADDLAVYVSYVDVKNIQQMVHSACDGFIEFFWDIELSMS